MVISKEFKGKTIEDAIQNGLFQLQMDRDDVALEVLERESRGFLGFGKKDALVKLSYDDGKPEPKPMPKPAKPIEPTKAKETFQAKKPEVSQEKPSRPQPKKPPMPKQNKKPQAPKTEAPQKTQLQAPKAEKPQKVLNPEAIAHTESVAEDFLKGILEVMGVNAQLKGSVNAEDNTINIELSGENMGFVIGRRGETLDALQYLATIVTNKAEDSRWRVSLDTENYRQKRTNALVALAHKTANGVMKTGKSVALEPMSPQERRIIHSALQDNKAVTTFSTGQEPRRKIVIALANAKKSPKSIKKQS